MLSEEGIKEQLSVAYVHAVAAIAGFSCERMVVDLDSVDVKICAKGRLALDSILNSPELSIQLKATSSAVDDGERITYAISMKNYNDLRKTVLVPRLLVVLILPQDTASWLSLSPEMLIARKCAYWHSLLNAPGSTNATKQTVHIPTSNVLYPETLRTLMIMVSKRQEIPHEE